MVVQCSTIRFDKLIAQLRKDRKFILHDSKEEFKLCFRDFIKVRDDILGHSLLLEYIKFTESADFALFISCTVHYSQR